MRKKLLIMTVITVLSIGFSKINSQAAFTECNGNHAWSKWEIGKKATSDNYGQKSRLCKKCHLKQLKTIPKKTATSSEKKVTATVDNFFKYSQKYNGKKLNSLFVSKPKDKFFVTNSYMTKFCTKYNTEALSYSITKVSIKGKKATVKVKVIYPNGWMALYNAFDDLTIYLIKHPKAKLNTQKKYLYKRALHYKDDIIASSKNITFVLKKTNKSWKINKSTKTMADIVNCGYETAGNLYFN